MSSQTQTLDMTMVDDLDEPLFNEAIEALHATISEEHRRTFAPNTDALSLFTELHSVSTSNKTGDRPLASSSRKFARFVQAFAPYFNVLSICCKVRDDWPGCFWGLVRLIFQTTRHHVLFLEKISDMLEAVANLLPPYERIRQVCEGRIASLETVTEDERLTALMSYVYADLMSVCLDIYCIFSRGLQRVELSHLTHITTHPSQWRPFDSRFAQLEARLTQHRRWLEKETQSQVQDFAEIERHRKKYIRCLKGLTGTGVNGDGELETQRVARRLKRVKKVRNWISDGPHLDQQNPSCPHDAGSCDWFFSTNKYRRWKEIIFDQARANDTVALYSDWHDRVLFVQAKPGFGKTFLAQTAIARLSAEAEDLYVSGEPCCTAFFHLNAARSELVRPDDVLRVFVCQLLHIHRNNHSTLDAVCLLLRKTSFQPTATASEVLDVLAILLRQHPTFLVLDGLDDCSDTTELLASLAELCRNSDTRVILFSRPNVRIPLEYQKWASDAPHILTLDERHNAAAIEQYLTDNLHDMTAQGCSGISTDAMLASQVAQRSDGTFLWANVLLRYLQPPALTPDLRRGILEDVDSLHTLEALYRIVLDGLAARPQLEKRIIADVFRWLSFPIHRLCSSALRTALSSSLNAAEFEMVFPTADVIDALPQLTYGLIDVDNHGVFFIHPSLREYLHSPQSQHSEFSLCDESTVHAHLAARCLSYLAYNVPKRPLGGLSPHIRPSMPSSAASQRTSRSGDSGYKSVSSSGTDHHLPHPAIHTHHSNGSHASIRTIPFDTNLPFLRYASLCWPIHLSRVLAPTQPNNDILTTAPGSFGIVPYLFPLRAFLSSRLAVTAWVEASFRYNLPPTLTRLVGPLSDLKGEIPPATVEGHELRLVVNEMSTLSEKLVELKREVASSLRENPSLIWQLGEGVGDDYWPVWDGSTGMPR